MEFFRISASVFLGIFILFLYVIGIIATAHTLEDREVDSDALIILFSVIPVFNWIYPLVYGDHNLKKELKKMFEK